MLDSKVKALAKTVRRHVQKWVEGNANIGQKDLLGACGIASFTLNKVLLVNGYSPTYVCGQSIDLFGHAWVELDGYIIDLTATQFGERNKVYIKPIHKYKYYDEFCNRFINAHAEEVVNWWIGQSPIIYKTKIDELINSLTP